MATTTSVSPTTVERNTSRRSHNNSLPHRSQSTRVKSSTADSPQRSHSHHHRGSSRHAAIEESVPQANYETTNVAQQSRKISSRDGPTPSRHESTRSATSNHRSNHHARPSNDMATAAANGGGPAPVVTPQESRHAAHRGKSRTSIPAQSGTWVLGKTIGQGSMGKVKLARKSEGGEQVILLFSFFFWFIGAIQISGVSFLLTTVYRLQSRLSHEDPQMTIIIKVERIKNELIIRKRFALPEKLLSSHSWTTHTSVA